MSTEPLYGISAERLAQLTGCHVTTARKWKRTRPPAWLQRLVAICVAGELGQVDPAWQGWSLRGGELVSPEGEAFSPGGVRAGPHYQRLALEHSRRSAELAAAIGSSSTRRAHLEQLEILQASLFTAAAALEQLAGNLTPREAERLFAAHPITRGRRARFERDGGKVRLRAVPSSSR